MKAWFKKHWKDCLVVFILFLVFGTMGYINYRAALQKRESNRQFIQDLKNLEILLEQDRKRTLELLKRCEPCLNGEKDA